MDIVEQLRTQANADERAGTLYAHEIGRKAADEIEALRNEFAYKADLVLHRAQHRDSWQCPNMKEVEGDLDMDYEHYECKVCGRTMKLDYDEMR